MTHTGPISSSNPTLLLPQCGRWHWIGDETIDEARSHAHSFAQALTADTSASVACVKWHIGGADRLTSRACTRKHSKVSFVEGSSIPLHERAALAVNLQTWLRGDVGSAATAHVGARKQRPTS